MADTEKAGALAHKTSSGHADDAKVDPTQDSLVYVRDADTSSDLLGNGTDAVLAAKMHLINVAIDEMGWTSIQSKLALLNGFGYATDSLLALVPSIVQGQVNYEYPPQASGIFPRGTTIGLYVGLFFGALFWGLFSDAFGRKWAFNSSLFISAIFTCLTAASPNYISVAVFNALLAFGAGGNLILDTTIFLEYLPSRHTWALTALACTWGIGQLIAGLIAWAFVAPDQYNCRQAAGCTRAENMGWRYVYVTTGLLVFVFAALRLIVIRMRETPKFLVAHGRDAEAVETLQLYARQANRPISLTLEALQACGELDPAEVERNSKFTFGGLWSHVKGLFSTPKLAWSTSLVFVAWSIIGLSYALYNVFLPYLLASRGADVGDGSIYTTYRDYAIVNTAGIFGPAIGAALCVIPRFGRRGTIGLGGLVTMAFLIGYTRVKTPAQNLGLNVGTNVALNVAYGCLYAYTPEVLPSAHRATGNALAVMWNRFFGIVSSLVAVYGDIQSTTPTYVTAGLMGSLAIVAFLFPFEPLGKRSS